MNSRRWLNLAGTLIIAAIGGGLATLAGLPAAWVTGGMVTVTAATIAGFDTRLPAPLLEVVFLVLGIGLGAGVTPELIQGLASWPISLTGQLITVFGCVWGVNLFLTRVVGWDRDTALFSSVPGALSQVVIVAAQTSADIRKVAVSQSVRVFLLVALLPSTILAVEPAGVAPGVVHQASLGEIALMLGACAAGGFLFRRLGVPAGMLTGSLAVSSVLHGTGLVVGTLPWPVMTAAFIVLGCLIGSRFRGTDVRFLIRIAVASLGVFVISAAIAGAMAVGVAAVTGDPLDQVIVAFAPGGLDAMTVLALALGMDSAFVAAHQLARFFIITLILPFIARNALRRGRGPAGDSQDSDSRP